MNRRRKSPPGRPRQNAASKPGARAFRGLNVRVDSRRSHRQRCWRRVRMLTLWLLVVSFGGGAVYGMTRVYQGFLSEDGPFRLERVQVEGGDLLSEAQVRALAGVRLGQSLLELEMEAIQARLAAHPLIAQAEVARRFPDTLSLRIEERRARAWLFCPGRGVRPRVSQGGYLIDADGVVFPCSSLKREFLTLPIVRVDQLEEELSQEAIRPPEVGHAMRLLRLLEERLPHHPLAVKDLAVRNAFSLELRLESGESVLFRKEDLERQIADLDVVLSYVESSGRELESLNLMMKTNLAARFADQADFGELDLPVRKARPVEREATGEGPPIPPPALEDSPAPPLDLAEEIEAILHPR
ncbi:MAG: FtsQ-type POTRA domain-containing protein [Verrucomicrobiota bacterium]